MSDGVLKYVQCLLMPFLECLYLSIEPIILGPEFMLHLSILNDLSARILPIVVHSLNMWVLHKFGKGERLDLGGRDTMSLGVSERLPIEAERELHCRRGHCLQATNKILLSPCSPATVSRTYLIDIRSVSDHLVHSYHHVNVVL